MSDLFGADGRRRIDVPTGGGGGGSGGVMIAVPGQTATSGTVVFSNSNNVTFGMAGSTRITGSYNFNVSAGTTSNNLNSLVFSNSGNVAFGLNASTLTASATVPVLTVGGNSTSAGAGFILVSSGTLTLAGGNNITLSQNGNAVTISAANAGGAQTAISGIAASNTTYTSGSVTFRDLNGVSWGTTTGQQIQITHALQFTSGTSAITSNAVNTSSPRVFNVVAATNTTGGGTASLSSDVSFKNSNGATFYTLAGNAIALSYSVPVVGGAQTGISGIAASNTTYTSGSVTFRDLNGISWGTTTGQQIQITHDLQYTSNTSLITSNNLLTNAGRVINLAVATNNTGGGIVSISSQISLANVNGATWYTSTTNGATQIVLSYSVPTQTNQSAIKGLGVSNTGNTAGNTGISTGIDWVIAGTNGITVSESTAGGGPNTIWLSGGGGGGNVTLGVSTFGNTAGTTGDAHGNAVQYYFVGTNNITLSQSIDGGNKSATLSIVGPSTVAQSNQTGGIYLSAGTTLGESSSSTYDLRSLTITLGGDISGGWTNGSLLLGANPYVVFSAGGLSNSLTRLFFSNANNISFGLAGGANSTRLTASYAFNVSGGTTSSGTNGVTFSDANGVFFGYDGTNVSANAGYLSYYENLPWLVATGTMTQGNSTAALVPFNMPSPGSFSYMRVPHTFSTNSTTQTATTNSSFGFSGSILSTIYVVVYSMGTGANSRSLQSVTSGSAGVSHQISMSVSSGVNGSGTRWSVTQKMTYPQEGATNITFSATTAQSSGVLGVNTEATNSDFNGFKHLDIPFAASLSAGAYWLAFGRSSTTSTQSLAFVTGARIDQSNICATQGNTPWGLFGLATSSSNALQVGIGSYTTNAMTTASIALSQISSSVSHMHPYFQLIRQA